MLQSINPATLKVLNEYNVRSSNEVTSILEKTTQAYQKWRKSSFANREKLFINLANLLQERAEHLAQLMTAEMGKPITQARSEVDKCAWLCAYYVEHASDFLADELIETDYHKSIMSYEPIGAVLAVMPWNYPLWQVFRFAVPTLFAGNVGLLKHASNVPQCALAIEQLFTDAGFPDNVFTTLLIETKLVEEIIQHEIVQAISLTGSNEAGSIVASQAAKEIKKSVLELGGNDAFIVCEDADVALAAQQGRIGRFQNNGQSCIAAKRFFIHEAVYEQFMELFQHEVKQLKLGNPAHEDVDIGPLAKPEFAKMLQEQVNQSIERGATLCMGGSRTGEKLQYFLPTILEDVKPGMPAFDEELFGPVAAICKVSSIEEAIELANQSNYGLGATLWTNHDNALQLAKQLEAGTVAINDIVKSDPRVPFGGVKQSGFGRELSQDGIREFVNKKAIHWNKIN